MNEQKLTAAIDKAWSRLTEEAGLVGGAVSVVKDGKIVYTYEYGYADRENKLPFTQDTLCDVASTSKAWTTMLAAQAIDDGLIDGWDTPIKNHIPEFEMYDKYAGEHLSVRDMASHRTGVPGHDMMREKDYENREILMRKTALLEPNYGFRTRYQYNNHFFILLGYLVERVRGMKWEEMIKKYISDPLGVDEIRFRGVPSDMSTVSPAIPYGGNGFTSRRCNYSDNYTSAPCGGVRISMKNMSKWVIAMARGGVCDSGERLCSEQQYKELITPVISTPEEDCFFLKNTGYAQGWINGDYKGDTVVFHSGGHTGFNTQVGFLPGKNCGYAMCVNTGSTPAHKVARAIVLDYLTSGTVADSYDDMIDAWVQTRDDMAAKRSLYENGTPTTVESHGSLVGKYSHPAYGFFEIAPNEEGKLVFHYGIVTGEIRVEPSGVLSAYNGWLDGLTPVGVELYPEPNGDLRVNHPDNYGLILTFTKEK